MNATAMTSAVGGLILGLFLLATGGVARADDEDRIAFGLTPSNYPGSYFDLTMEPGETQQLGVEVANHGTATGTARTYAADVYTIINGGMGVRLDGELLTGATLWLEYAPQDISLKPRDALQRTFTVTVPAGTPPGEYTTAIVVQNAEPVAIGGGQGVAMNQVDRHAIAVAITVPGERLPGMAIGTLRHEYAADTSILSFDVENTGNVRLRPEGEFVLFDEAGEELTRYPVSMDTFFPGDGTRIEVPLTRTLDPGDYWATLVLKHEGGVNSTSRVAVNVPKLPTPETSASPGVERSRTAEVRERVTESTESLAAQPVLLAGATFAGIAVLTYLAVRLVRGRRQRGWEPGDHDWVQHGRTAWATGSPFETDALPLVVRGRRNPPSSAGSRAVDEAAGSLEDPQPGPERRAFPAARPLSDSPRFEARFRGQRGASPSGRGPEQGASSPW